MVVGLVLVAFCGITGVGIAVGIGWPSGEEIKSILTAGGTSQSNNHQVTYEVSGDGSVAVSYISDGLSAQEQITSVTLPWAKQFTVRQKPINVWVIVRRLSDQTGAITCRVLVDGRVVKKATSTGSAAATCTELVM